MIKWFINWLFPASPSRALFTDPEPVRKYEPRRIKAPSALDVPTPRRRPVRATPPQRRETEASPARQPRRSYVEDSSSALTDVMIGVGISSLLSDTSSSYDSSPSPSPDFSGGGGDFGGGGADSSW